MSVSADYRRLLQREVKIYSIIQKSFKKQKEFLHDNVKDLYEKYPYSICIERSKLNNQQVHLFPEKKSWETMWWIDVLDWFWKMMWVYDLIKDMKPQLERAVEKGYKRILKILVILNTTIIPDPSDDPRPVAPINGLYFFTSKNSEIFCLFLSVEY